MADQGRIIPQAATPQFPGCALNCATLLNAQSVCLPPTQPKSSQLVYDQCFCASAFLTPFATTTDGVCVTECPSLADRQLLQAWYNSFCAQVRNGIDPNTLTSASTSTVATSIISVTSGTLVATVTATSTSSGASSTQHQTGNQSWISTHWKYILMIVIIAVGLAFLAWLAVRLKRRHQRKLESQRAAASGFGYDPEKRPANDPRRSATPDLWGPHQMMQATQGYGYDTEIVGGSTRRSSKKYRGAESSKRGENDMIEVAGIDQARTRLSNKRARPSELEINARMIGAADRRSKSRKKSRSASELRSEKALDAGEAEQSRSKDTDRDP